MEELQSPVQITSSCHLWLVKRIASSRTHVYFEEVLENFNSILSGSEELDLKMGTSWPVGYPRQAGVSRWPASLVSHHDVALLN